MIIGRQKPVDTRQTCRVEKINFALIGLLIETLQIKLILLSFLIQYLKANAKFMMSAKQLKVLHKHFKIDLFSITLDKKVE